MQFFWWNYAAIKSQKSWRIYGENACHLCLEKKVVFLITPIIFALKKEKLFLYDMKVTLWLRMNLNLRFTIRRNVFITQLYSAYPSEWILTFLVQTNFWRPLEHCCTELNEFKIDNHQNVANPSTHLLSPHESTQIFGQKWWRRSNYSFISLIYGKLCENATYWAMSVQDIIAGGNGQTQWSNQGTQRKVGFIHCCTFIQKRTLWHGCQNGEYYLAA